MSTLNGGTDGFSLEGESPGGGSNPLMMVHRALRGRYAIAALLGVLLAAPGGVLGYLALKPVYTSTAVLEAAPTLPTLLYQNELNEKMQAFDAFVAQQASALQSERVLTNALLNTELRALGWPAGAPGLIRLKEAMGVRTPRNANQIFLSISDPSPEAARVAAKAILDSYEAIRREIEVTTFGAREQNLERLRDNYRRERDEKRRMAIDRALAVAGTEDLQHAQRTRVEELAVIDQDIVQTRERLAQVRGERPSLPPTAPDDPVLSMLLRERQQLERILETLLQRFTPEHRECRRIQSEITAVNTLIAAREAEFSPVPGAGEDSSESSEIARLQGRLQDLQRLRDEADEKIKDLARRRLDIITLQQEAEEANSRFEDAERRLESLRVEKQAQIVGRVRVAQEPDRPLSPSTDRRLPIAAAGFLGGGGLGVALVAAFGLLLPRLRVADDVTATARDLSLLGMIPEFAGRGEQQPDANLWDSFHFLRVMLDARGRGGTLMAGITSPTSGDGKTTISLLLARSFAMTKRRVLLIDADLVGRGLSRLLEIDPADEERGEEPTLDQLVVPIDGGRLDFLPASKSESASEGYCRHLVQRLLKVARERYDVVLLDTGPILGSIEAAAMVPAVDQMLLVVPRGLETRLLKMSTDRLRDLNARSIGLVFNRATNVDFNRSFAPTSSISQRHSNRTRQVMIPPSFHAESMRTERDGDNAA
jgi:Mrp family chromosome partitioning ATPase/uncharacterized protein involved in exopolysaccharide biosynthesis